MILGQNKDAIMFETGMSFPVPYTGPTYSMPIVLICSRGHENNQREA